MLCARFLVFIWGAKRGKGAYRRCPERPADLQAPAGQICRVANAGGGEATLFDGSGAGRSACARGPGAVEWGCPRGRAASSPLTFILAALLRPARPHGLPSCPPRAARRCLRVLPRVIPGAALLQPIRCSKRPALPAATMSDNLDDSPAHPAWGLLREGVKSYAKRPVAVSHSRVDFPRDRHSGRASPA